MNNNINFRTLRKIFVFCIVFLLSLLLSSMYIINAYASINSDDKLYSESFSKREMPLKDCPNVGSKYACLMDRYGNIIYERNAYEASKIASMTKIMTAIVTLENCDLNEELTITEQAVKVGESSAGLWVNDKITVLNALYALLVPSGNDAAEALCNYTGNKLIKNQDSRLLNDSDEITVNADEAFCKIMNDKATELGCTNTYFTNPHGLDNDEFHNDSQKSCAADVAKFSRYAMKNEIFRKIVGGGSTSIDVNRQGNNIKIPLETTDQLLDKYEGCIGVKTGITDEAGACFSGACKDSSGIEIYTVVMNAPNEGARFTDTQNLFDWYFNNKVNINLENSNLKQTMIYDNQEKTVNVIGYIAHPQWVNCEIPVTVSNSDIPIAVLKIAGNVHYKIESNDINGNIEAGDIIGKLIITQHNVETLKIDLIAVSKQEAPNIFQTIGVAFDRFIRNITSQNTTGDNYAIINESDINNNNNK